MAGADTGLYVVPALGGPERKLRSTRIPYFFAAPISWSPDGQWIAFGDPSPTEPADRIFLLSLDTLESRPIPHNPKCLHEATPTFSNAGDRLVYLCVHSTNEFELYSVAPFGGAPKLVTAFSNIPLGLTWSADDSKLFLSLLSDGGPDLREVVLADGSFQLLDFAPNATWPAVPLKGDKLAYSSSSNNTNIWRKDLQHPESPAVKLISSTRQQEDPQYSPDGKHIAFESTRGGPQEVWMADADGTNPVQLSKLHRDSGTPSWSPDGEKIVFDARRFGHLEIYVVDISERVPRKLVTNVQEISTPSWSRDGKWIYFRSYEAVGGKIYRCPAAGGDAVPIARRPDAISQQESFDGEDLYFAIRGLNGELRKVSLKSGFVESAVEGLSPVVHWPLWTIVARGIYLVPADSPKSLRYFDFATKKVREVFTLDKDFDDGLSVSPDGRYILYSQIDEQNSDIMLVDNFR
jgi:Tol biopolymer transport system component